MDTQSGEQTTRSDPTLPETRVMELATVEVHEHIHAQGELTQTPPDHDSVGAPEPRNRDSDLQLKNGEDAVPPAKGEETRRETDST